ncbi:hypothetical protein FC905_03770 [Clostridium botulinum]|nr:hypothetical protein [Clostridium botulinum]NFJ04173.1 hypothetical protein [Clostridium botulinum]
MFYFGTCVEFYRNNYIYVIIYGKIYMIIYTYGYSYIQIIKCLNDKGYKSKNVEIRSNSIYSILENEKYSGVYVFNKSSKKETFEKIREMMPSRKKEIGANKDKELYLLSGLIYCGWAV